MRLRPQDDCPLSLLLLTLLSVSVTPTVADPGYSLSSFQKIYGFSTACTIAYNTPIPGCTSNDFINGDPCSLNCIAGLETIQALLNAACQGTEADPTTLIGLFFEGKGVQELCPNVISGSAGGSAGGNSGSGSQPSTSTTSTVAVVSSTTTSMPTPTPVLSSTSTSSRPATPTTSATTLSTSMPSTSSTSTVSPSASSSNSMTSLTPSMTATPNSTSGVMAGGTAHSSSTTSAPAASFTKTVVNDGTAVVITSKPEQTSSNNPDAFGGGGSPFEISAGSQMAVNIWILWGAVLSGLTVWGKLMV